MVCPEKLMFILGVDPGSYKCGLAVLDKNKNVCFHEVVLTKQIISYIKELKDKYLFNEIILGNGTGSKNIKMIIKEKVPDIQVHEVDEKMTTLLARALYWKLYPPKGLWKLIPASLRLPPRPYDDIVAIILTERYIEEKNLSNC